MKNILLILTLVFSTTIQATNTCSQNPNTDRNCKGGSVNDACVTHDVTLGKCAQFGPAENGVVDCKCLAVPVNRLSIQHDELNENDQSFFQMDHF